MRLWCRPLHHIALFLVAGGRAGACFCRKHSKTGRAEPQALPLAGGQTAGCKGGESASLRGGVKLNIGLSLALPASASLRYGREAEPRRHCNLFSASSSAAPQIYKRNGKRSLYLPPPLRYLILFWIRTKIDTLEECCSTIELRELVQ